MGKTGADNTGGVRHGTIAARRRGRGILMTLIEKMTAPVYEKFMAAGRTKLAEMYRKCFASTWETTLVRSDDSVFLVTGDIPAMWLRDSSAQVYHYLPHATEYPEVFDTIRLLIKRQFQLIALDPRANAFNREPKDQHHVTDRSDMTEAQRPWIWERKYEVDSLCYPIRLSYAFWKKTGSTACFEDEAFSRAITNILDVWETEQHHETSPYFFERERCPASDTLPNAGRGTPVGYTGMTWSGFRPSDDACQMGYLIPANFFAAKSLEQLEEIVKAVMPDEALETRIRALHAAISDGLRKYAVVSTERFGDVYAYETDGLGGYVFMDDANVPSLLSLPYLGCVPADDPVYKNTRRMILSDANPYYYEGAAVRGIGSPHTPEHYVWPISLCIQGLTSDDPDEIRFLIDRLSAIDAGTGLMHEGVHADDPNRFTREWFAWANSIFSEFAEKAANYL